MHAKFKIICATSDAIQNAPTLKAASIQLDQVNADLAGVNKMGEHLPDNPTYQQRKRKDLTAIASNAQLNPAKVEAEFGQLTDRMLNLIRHKKLKNSKIQTYPRVSLILKPMNRILMANRK